MNKRVGFWGWPLFSVSLLTLVVLAVFSARAYGLGDTRTVKTGPTTWRLTPQVETLYEISVNEPLLSTSDGLEGADAGAQVTTGVWEKLSLEGLPTTLTVEVHGQQATFGGRGSFAGGSPAQWLSDSALERWALSLSGGGSTDLAADSWAIVQECVSVWEIDAKCGQPVGIRYSPNGIKGSVLGRTWDSGSSKYDSGSMTYWTSGPFTTGGGGVGRPALNGAAGVRTGLPSLAKTAVYVVGVGGRNGDGTYWWDVWSMVGIDNGYDLLTGSHDEATSSAVPYTVGDTSRWDYMPYASLVGYPVGAGNPAPEYGMNVDVHFCAGTTDDPTVVGALAGFVAGLEWEDVSTWGGPVLSEDDQIGADAALPASGWSAKLDGFWDSVQGLLEPLGALLWPFTRLGGL